MRSHSLANRTPSGSGFRRRFVVWFFVTFDFGIVITPANCAASWWGEQWLALRRCLFLIVLLGTPESDGQGHRDVPAILRFLRSNSMRKRS
jgi:hypothetical protein